MREFKGCNERPITIAFAVVFSSRLLPYEALSGC
jgi:hypothetical protein